ncbi:putative F-box protein PP2-B12 [Morella rubra]|uniref:Putative F-box protein PP2-B12 n=1 Tax=Morella rubra TaxID=262757 RepID=A0A6A1VH80_9ROSI|nr:putative F-box protein PP2-B12 [Morella rubra]
MMFTVVEQSFAIDKLNEKKCYMLGKFAEVARKQADSRRQILFGDEIETQILSPNTTSGTYFVYTMGYTAFNLEHPVKLSLRSGNEMEGNASIGYLLQAKWYTVPLRPKGRRTHCGKDNWLEIKIGEFFNGEDDGVVEMRLWENEHGGWNNGLVVHGIELRPKDK